MKLLKEPLLHFLLIDAALLAFADSKACHTLGLDHPSWVTRIPGYAVGALRTIQRVLPTWLSSEPRSRYHIAETPSAKVS